MIAFDLAVSRGAFSARFLGELGPFSVIGGPSGSGKTTLLDAIAGLIPSRGRCLVDGLPLHELPAHQRGAGYAFQDDRLFPHLTVEKNLLFSKKSARFAEIVDALELAPLLTRRPRDLSGGEKRRAGIGRAILAAERLLILDEPLSPLDAALRSSVGAQIQEIAKTVPVIVVSHEPIAGDHIEISTVIQAH